MRDEAFCISDIVLWELAQLHRDERIRLPLDEPRLQRLIGNLTVWPIPYHVAMARRRVDFRADPADEIIAATSLAHGVPLLTPDMTILRSKVVPLALTT